MRLKRLELSGFKSFVDPTRIDLGEGITAVVGPNGSGKSNVVDAIRWVLGEHSARHLRGGVMDDLIFQGSESRASVAVCDVELTFAVHHGMLPSPYHECDEISIRRRLTRDGGSDAYINGKAVRIKDIVDIFLDTGISTRAYAIVEQGSIARMITAKPEERRLLLEEAAGVMKYRARRKETEHKMHSTRQNMERVMDLLDEVQSQCRSLRQQASRAERFRTMQTKCETLQRQYFGLCYQQQHAQVTAEEQLLHAADVQVEQATAAHTGHEQTLVNARLQLQQQEEGIQQAQDSLLQSEHQRANLQQQIERMAGERRLLQERLLMLKQRMQETETRKEALQTEIALIRAQRASYDDAALQQKQQHTQTAFEQSRQQVQQFRQQRDTVLAEFERLRGALQSVEQRRQQASQMLQRLQQRQKHVQQNLQQAAEQTGAFRQALAKADTEIQQATEALVSQEQLLQHRQKAVDLAKSKQQAALQQRNNQETQWRAVRGNIEELQARFEQQQGLSPEVRKALQSHGGVWVDELLNVPEGLELAVAAVLRGHEADVMFAQNDCWDKCDMATLNNVPVAMFIHSAVQQHASDATTYPRLADVLQISSEHPLYAMFAQVLLVDHVMELRHSHPACAVSRDGWRLETSGWLIPPARQQTARRLQTKRLLQAAHKKLDAMSGQYQQAEQALTHAEQALAYA